MLELKNIHKTYDAGYNRVEALRGIDLQFRKSEFVAILGPSGCGKTTLLNLIGGLDRYSAGDLVINGRSTKDYKDRDWDAYRNHSVGFVFQSYNLIPHQSVLSNVELALTLTGVGRKERRRRAREALEQVGLGDQLSKKPSQMSGGQMQRVAIARALVNNPDIILADEPTGALDTQTSIQVMEILKQVAKDRLVIMVTHNPDLADTYATRTIKMLDGKVTDDTAPLTADELEALHESHMAASGKVKKPSMSLLTSFSLSLKNLITKKGRTTLTAFAGSIGIIGIALIFAVSQGTSNYIQAIQEDTLASYPLTLSASTMDISTLMTTFMDMRASEDETHPLDGVYSKSALSDMVNAMNNMETVENDLKSFKAYMEADLVNPQSTSGLQTALSGVQYTYDFDLQVYTKNVDGKVIYSDTQSVLMDAIKNNMGMDMTSMLSMQGQMPGASSQMMSGGMQLWNQLLSGMDGSLISPVLEKQYRVIEGRWPAAYNEIVLVVDENHEVNDLTLYALGLLSEEEINKIFDAAQNGTTVDNTQKRWSYAEIMDMTFRVVPGGECFAKDSLTGRYVDLRESESGLRYLYDKGIDLKISGIICLREDADSNMLKGAIGYTVALTEYLIDSVQDSQAIQDQLDMPTQDIFTGKPFRENTGNLTQEEKKTQFIHYVDSLSDNLKAETYLRILSVPDPQQLKEQIAAMVAQVNREDMELMMVQAMMQQMGISESEAQGYAAAMSTQELEELYRQMAEMQIRLRQETAVRQQMAKVPQTQLIAMLEAAMEEYTVEEFALYYDEVTDFSESSLEENLRILGYADLDDPASINLYASTFENKDVIESFIADYNAQVEQMQQIRYTDMVGLMISAVTTIINAITYVLIAFVAISLVVSSIMIGVITLISVQERTKEIGILRSIGASKRNISSMFTAETVIVGLAAGLLGVGVTYLACIPINALVKVLTGLNNLKAHLPLNVAVILVIISVVLTLISGIIPSRSAAKKDPVVALRTE